MKEVYVPALVFSFNIIAFLILKHKFVQLVMYEYAFVSIGMMIIISLKNKERTGKFGFFYQQLGYLVFTMVVSGTLFLFIYLLTEKIN